ncbi:unnamed protein product [Cercopithifilaria johnstoni]|uniref:SHSP domain-containing protein n=1 Tax=Cercopithifilaria johnstoni TaxID=2874296 RepID=A0A8J2M5I7_9BILA|nr:unnamed protein product [Cercopithifilaria johnstoni]
MVHEFIPPGIIFWGPGIRCHQCLEILTGSCRKLSNSLIECFVRNSREWFNNFRPIGVREHPSQIEAYRVLNPIVEEDGVKKFLLELDVRRFKPEEVIVKTNAKENTLTVQAKHKDDETNFEYLRKVTLPQGVVSKDMTCHFTSDGILQIKAPYNAPQEAIAVDTEIPVKHE